MDEGQANDPDFSCRKNTLALRLQQRRSRKVLAEQGIIPPLKSPGTFFEQVQKLERAHKEKFLNKAIQIRPVRDELVQKHILEDTSASNAIVAHQKDLKKAQLVDDLNDKIAFRPGVIELVERNIIQATEPFHEALKGGQIQYKKISDLVDEDSGEALSPEQVPPPPTSSPPLVLHIATSIPAPITTVADRSIKSEEKCLMKSPSSSSLYSQTTSHPYLSRQLSKGTKLGQSTSISRITTSRKKKEKPKFKKFKYHQYVPPDQQQGKSTRLIHPNETEDDTPYSRLLQQQQLYLQLQIMNKQYNQRSGDSSQQTGSFSQKGLNLPPPPPMSQGMKSEKPRSTVALTLGRIEEMKVSELKEELKFRRLKVTGTKEVLVERLKPFCVDSENPFLTDVQAVDENSSSMSYVTASSPTAMSDVTFSGVDSNHVMPPIITQGMAMSPPNPDQVGSNEAGPSSAYNLDPNTVFTHRVAQMPVPKQHKIILKQEKFTMPTWHSNIKDARVVSISSHGPTSSSFSYPDASDVNKDQLLEKQQKEINDLRRMVELHRSQLMQLQEQNTTDVKHEQPPSQNHQQPQAFEFPPTGLTNHRVQPTVQFCSSNPSVARQNSQPFNSPPNYDQAYEMMNDGEARGNPQQENVSRQMDDLLELLADQGELPPTPVVTRQRLNDHPSYQGLSDPSARHHHGYAHHQHPHRLPSNEYGTVIAQERAQLQQEIAQQHQQQQNYSHRGSRDFASPDVAKMLVETAGDALMDTSSFPPVITSALNDRCADQPLNYSRASARNSVDSGIIYSNSHYSPMDTNMDGSSKDLFNDLRLSSSSLDSGEPTLNRVSLSPATPPRPKPYLQSTFRPHPSPRASHNHLVKSASQELLSTSDTSTTGNHPMDNKLGWLDLTLGSAVGGPPSPGGPFGYMNSDEGHLQHNRYHPGMGYNSFHENENILGAGGSTGALNVNPGLGGTGVEQWDPWDGILEPNFGT